ncbi:MAG: hypothetical protein ACYDH2_16795 [Anaerolineaceae bacterium]
MSRKLEKLDIETEIAAVDKLLAESIELEDPVGEYQFSKRKELLQQNLRELEETPNGSANVVLYFGGDPVFGSRGILSEFAGTALGKFQELITKAYATNELGKLGERGPVPLKQAASLMITNIARGSLGFVLDESPNEESLFNSELKNVVESVSSLIENTASPIEERFEEAMAELDPRTLMALREFFVILDSGGATLRLVEEQFDFTLDKPSIRRARLRTESTTIDEDDDILEGLFVGLLPGHKKFEIQVAGDLSYGTVSKEAGEQYSQYIKTGSIIPGMSVTIKVKRRIVHPLNRPPKEALRLLEFIKLDKRES